MPKLDPTLQYLAWCHAQWHDRSSGEEVDAARPPPESADLAVIFTGDLADLEAAGFVPRTVKRHPTEGFTLATGSIAVGRLTELDDIEHLQRTEASRPMRPELNRSVDEINADDVHGAPTNLKGAGVVIGIIDSGFDIHHQNFRTADGTSRVLAIWDQAIEPDDADALPGEQHPANFAFGVEYGHARIDAAVKTNRKLVRTTDRDVDDGELRGHGTHVLGIAAGDGSQAGNCRGTFVFVGVAPEAEIILVRLETEDDNFELGGSTRLVDALEWIWRHPATQNKPVVVNLSIGDNMGAHDGTSSVESSIALETLLVPGHVVVKSAGNAAEDHQHAEGTVAPGAPVTIGVAVRPRDGNDRHLDLWYRGDGRLDVQLIGPGAGPPTSQVFHPGAILERWTLNPAAAANRRNRVFVTSSVDDVLEQRHQIHIFFEPGSRTRIPAGPWQVVLTNTGAAEVSFDAWIDRGKRQRQDTPPHHTAPYFTSHVTSARTITVPGTTDGCITVGSYSQGTKFFDSTGDVEAGSSRGPTRDGRTKPDLAAPGVSIKSAAAEELDNCCSDCCENFYLNKSGTSMAAPHVTGVVALMLQKNGTLPTSDVKRILMATARPHGGGSPQAPDNVIGAGKLNAFAAVEATPPPGQPVVGGGGGGGGGPIPAARTLDAERARDWLASGEGQLWAALVSSHISEVRGLIANNRRVAGFWQLLSGPRLVRAAVAFARTGDPILLSQLDAPEIDRRAAGFLRVLAKYGSPRLRRDVDRHGSALLDLGWDGVLARLAGQTGKAA